MTRCSICNSERVREIDDLADSGTATLKEIAQQFGCSYPALVRHCARHRKNAPAPATENGETLEVQAEKWRMRADELWARASIDADSRGMAQAVSAGLRSVELKLRQDKTLETAPAPAGETPVTIEAIDAIIRKEMDATPRGRNLNRLYGAPDAGLEIAVRVLDNPESWGAVETVLEGRL